MSYLDDRAKDEAKKLIGTASDECAKELQKEYVKLARKTINEIQDLYKEILLASADGTLLVSDLYKYKRYFDIFNQLNKDLVKFGFKEIEIIDKSLTSMYLSRLDDSFSGFIAEDMAKRCIEAIWCADGKTWSSRVWSSTEQLKQRLQDGLIDCVARGTKTDELIRTLQREFGVSFNQADRIVRTEMSYVYNQATLDKYQAEGVRQYKFLGDQAGACDLCSSLDGQIFNIEDAVVGVNFPPCHPFAVVLYQLSFDLRLLQYCNFGQRWLIT